MGIITGSEVTGFGAVTDLGVDSEDFGVDAGSGVTDIASDHSGKMQVTGYQYDFGFDNFTAYYKEYESRGIYVGKKLMVIQPGLIALKTKETKPEIQIGGVDICPFSFEYTLFKRNYTSGKGLIDEEVVPILPLADIDSDINERLFLSETDSSITKNVAYFRFTPTVTVASSIYPVIKMNFSTLTIGTDYVVKARGGDWRSTWATVETDIKTGTFATSYKLTVAIKFVSPNARAFYTTDYTVSASTTTTNYRQTGEWVKMQQDGFIRCDGDRGGDQKVEISDLYLIVLMRRNHLAPDLTASLEEYKLLASGLDKDKFTGTPGTLSDAGQVEGMLKL